MTEADDPALLVSARSSDQSSLGIIKLDSFAGECRSAVGCTRGHTALLFYSIFCFSDLENTVVTLTFDFELDLHVR